MMENEAISRIKDHMEIHRLKEPRAIYITVALSMAIEALKEVQQYRKIGTVKECREAVEKQKVLNTTIYNGVTNQRIFANAYVCPKCNKLVVQSQRLKANFCPECGQRIHNESEEE